MATVTDQDKPRVSLKLLVDEKRNRVYLAEASKDFVDVLFGFLTLPIGKIIRIIGNQEIHSGIMGGMSHLYKSVEGLHEDNFSTKSYKSYLLNPNNPWEEICMNLKVKIDDSNPGKYYKCYRCYFMSSCSGARCSCGGVFNQETHLNYQHRSDDECRSVFLKGGLFIVTDDLQVRLNSPSSLVQHLSNLGITDLTRVTEMSVEAGVEEISSLLICSLISKSPLTDVFLVKKGKSMNPIMPGPGNLAPSSCEANSGTSTSQLSLKLVLGKSTNRVLCAEASDDFANFLFSFLTIPLGSVVKLLHGQTGLECIDNLQKSVENLEPKWLCMEKDILLQAGVAIEYKFWSQPLQMQRAMREYGVMGTGDPAVERLSGRFMKTPSLFLASDNLVVRELSSTSCIGFLKELNIPICDIEERTVTVGEAEALGILKASLTSSSALTNGLNSLLKNHKGEE